MRFIGWYTFEVNRKAGFTLIEVVVTVTILVVVLPVVGYFFRDIFYVGSVTGNDIESQYSMRQVLRQFVKEVRTAEPSISGSYSIAEATNTSFTVYSDVSSDQFPDKVEYVLEDTNLLKKVYEAQNTATDSYIYPTSPTTTFILANSVVNEITEPIFNYYESGDVASQGSLTIPVDLSLVRYVTMTLVIDENPSRAPEPVTIQTGVTVRNLRDNL